MTYVATEPRAHGVLFSDLALSPSRDERKRARADHHQLPRLAAYGCHLAARAWRSLERLAARCQEQTHPAGRPRIPSYPSARLPPDSARAPADDDPPVAPARAERVARD